MAQHRVVVTGTGVVAPGGNDTSTFWHNLLAGKPAVGVLEGYEEQGFACWIGAQVKDFDPGTILDRRELKRTDRFIHLAMGAADQALEQSGLDLDQEDPYQVGVCLGSAIGGMQAMADNLDTLQERGPTRVSPLFVPAMIPNMAAARASMHWNLRGPNTTTETACASATMALGVAFNWLRDGEAEVMLAGGTDSVFEPLMFAALCATRAMTSRNDDPLHASRPFDRTRDGMVMGEGAGVLMLETLEHAQARGANILAEIVGYGNCADAYHVTAPNPDGSGEAKSIQRALRDARLNPGDVDYINAHATSTPAGDEAETLAIKQVFGDHTSQMPVSSIKSMTGHPLGAAGAVEAVACVQVLQEQVLPPTINYEHPDPDCDLDVVPNEAREHQVNVLLSNSFGFGGQNAVLAMRRFDG